MRFRCSCIGLTLAKVAAAILLLLPNPALAQCDIPPVASFPLMTEGRPIIPVVIQGREATMMVDTGAEVTSVTPEAAQLLQLPRDPTKRSLIRTVAGEELLPNVVFDHLQAGPLDFGRQSVPLVSLGTANTFAGHLIAGLIGMDFFGAYDIEVDLAGHRMTLYPRSACSPMEPPWPRGTYASVDAVSTPKRRLLVPVTLNGQRIVALLDTGAQGELLTRSAAERVGMSTIQIDTGPVSHGIAAGARTYPVRVFRFDSFGVAGEITRGVIFPVGEFHQDSVDMLLGINYMRLHRVFLALGAHKLFIQRADGWPMAPMVGATAPAASSAASLGPPTGVEHCRAPAAAAPMISREVLQALIRPRLPIPASVQAGLTEACAGVAFRVAPDGSVHDIEVLTEWPSGYGVGEYVRRELEGTRFRPGADGPAALHYEAHRLHAN